LMFFLLASIPAESRIALSRSRSKFATDKHLLHGAPAG
jgi:hypothetical protein